MLRGINKQIIEIKCPNNECFEKILLFVKSENGNFTTDILHQKSMQYYDSVMSSFGRIPLYKQKRFKFFIAVLAVMALLVSGTILYLL